MSKHTLTDDIQPPDADQVAKDDAKLRELLSSSESPAKRVVTPTLRFEQITLYPDSAQRRLAEKPLASFSWPRADGSEKTVDVYRATYENVLDVEERIGVSPMNADFNAARSIPLKHQPWVISLATKGGLTEEEIRASAYASCVQLWVEVLALFFLAGGPRVKLEQYHAPSD